MAADDMDSDAASVTVEEQDVDEELERLRSGARRGGGTTADTDSESDTASVAASTVDDLTEKMQEARARACARAGRISRLEKAALMVSSYAVWRALRRERKRTAGGVDRFRFKAIPRPEGTTEEEARTALHQLLGDRLAEPPGPAAPPPVEPETRGEGDAPPVDLPRATAWWHDEAARQATEPFKAGQVATVRLHWEDGMRPTPPRGTYFAWGPRVDTRLMAGEEEEAFLQILAKDVRSGALAPVSWDAVDVVTPLVLVRHPVTGKLRLVHDARAINARLRPSTVTLPKAADAMLGLGWAAKLDIAQAFRHIGLHTDDRRVTCVVVNGIPLEWQALSFGISHSPELFAQALEATMREVRRHLPAGSAVLVYVDDILIIANDRQTLDAAATRLLSMLRGGGWRVALDKCYLRAARAIPFLGLIADVERQQLRVSVAKATRLRDLCAAAIHRSRVTLRDLQRIGGLLAFFSIAAPEAGFARTGINAATAETERLPGRTVSVKGRLADDLVFWRRHALVLPVLSKVETGDEVLTVCTDHSGLPSLAWGGIVWEAGQPSPDIDGGFAAAREAAVKAKEQAGSGASSKPVWVACRGGGEAVAGPTSRELASESSAALEVVALRRVLRAVRQRRGAGFLRGRRVRWLCDAQVAVGAVGRWRAKAAGLSHQLHRLLDEVRAWECVVHPEWVCREAGWQPVADALSKLRWRRDTAEWSMPARDRQQVLRDVTGGAATEFVPTVDLFAAEGNAACPAFVARWPDCNAAWCDAFTRPWHGLRAWAFPPFAVAAAALRHAARARDFRGVFVVPCDAAVPACVHVEGSADLPPMRLLNAEGRMPLGRVPRPLRAIYVTTTREADGA